VIDRRTFIVSVAVTVLAAPLVAGAQQVGRVPQIGILSMAPTAETAVFDAFRTALRELGYVEGSNIVLDFRLSHGRADRLPALAADLVRARVDVIVTDGGAPTRAALEATREIPIVMGTGGSDPVASGFAKSLARPGGNVTGVTTIDVELVGKQLEILRDALPKLSRVAVLYNPATTRDLLKKALAAGGSLGLEVRAVEALTPDSLPAAFESIGRDRAEAVLVLNDRMLFDARARIAELAAKRSVPLMGENPFPAAGALIAYGASKLDSYRRAATYVDRVRKGAKPGDLPIEQPTKFELVINLKRAKVLGLTIPQSLLLRADQVIE
jgi:ABC-type uncharacterized transport system substrate-binding protein